MSFRGSQVVAAASTIGAVTFAGLLAAHRGYCRVVVHWPGTFCTKRRRFPKL